MQEAKASARPVLEFERDYVDASQHMGMYRDDWKRAPVQSRGELFRLMRSEHGRCSGYVYIDDAAGVARPVGWVFQQRVPYDDNPRRRFLCEVWVTWRYAYPAGIVPALEAI